MDSTLSTAILAHMVSLLSWGGVVPGLQSASFGLAIAFIAPGVVGLWGLSLHLPTVRAWFGATEAEATSAGFLFVLVASLAVGLTLSGIRQELLDKVVFDRLMGRPRPATDEMKLTDPNSLRALQYVAENLYRYYQFYSNMAVAVLFAYAAWIIQSWEWSWWRTGGLALLAAVILALVRSAWYSRGRYFDALQQILPLDEEAGSE
jgi:hypothetical protein